MPPKNMQSAPEDLIFDARVRKFAALVSMPSLPRTVIPAPRGLLGGRGDALTVDLLVVQDVRLVQPFSFW